MTESRDWISTCIADCDSHYQIEDGETKMTKMLRLSAIAQFTVVPWSKTDPMFPGDCWVLRTMKSETHPTNGDIVCCLQSTAASLLCTRKRYHTRRSILRRTKENTIPIRAWLGLAPLQTARKDTATGQLKYVLHPNGRCGWHSKPWLPSPLPLPCLCCHGATDRRLLLT